MINNTHLENIISISYYEPMDLTIFRSEKEDTLLYCIHGKQNLTTGKQIEIIAGGIANLEFYNGRKLDMFFIDEMGIYNKQDKKINHYSNPIGILDGPTDYDS